MCPPRASNNKRNILKQINKLRGQIRKLHDSYFEDSEQLNMYNENEQQIRTYIDGLKSEIRTIEMEIEMKVQADRALKQRLESDLSEIMESGNAEIEKALQDRSSFEDRYCVLTSKLKHLHDDIPIRRANYEDLITEGFGDLRKLKQRLDNSKHYLELNATLFGGREAVISGEDKSELIHRILELQSAHSTIQSQVGVLSRFKKSLEDQPEKIAGQVLVTDEQEDPHDALIDRV